VHVLSNRNVACKATSVRGLGGAPFWWVYFAFSHQKEREPGTDPAAQSLLRLAPPASRRGTPKFLFILVCYFWQISCFKRTYFFGKFYFATSFIIIIFAIL
jgi:hypothetical protein